MPSDAIIQVTKVNKEFQVGTQKVEVLKEVSLEIMFGDFAVIVGPSGCGKSTLLHIILGLEVPTSGRVVFLGEDIYNQTLEDDRSNFRKKHIGMIYQQPNWIKSMNVVENVAFPLMLLGMEKETSIEKAHGYLKLVKLDEWADYIPTELSGGQQQRIALARAMCNNPEIIIADEPTGNLDFQSGQDVMQLLLDLNKEQGKTIVMVTHDLEYLQFAKSAVQMFDGEVVKTFRGKEIDSLISTVTFKRGEKEKPTSIKPKIHVENLD